MQKPAPIGNKYAQQWTLENATPRFDDALKYATENEDCLCMQDAVYQTGIPSVTFYYLVENHTVLKLLKQEILNQIVIRINRLAIRNSAPAAAAIWRMKQLGERDEQHVQQTNNTTHNITAATKEQAKKINDLISDFDFDSDTDTE